MDRLPVLRPRLPSADRLLPYLRSIDAARIYSNHGPLASELERRLSDQFGLPAGGVVCTSSGTAAIIGAILATAGRAREKRPLAVIPAFTFVATASAVEQCGYEPYLADIDAASWMLEPERLARHPLLDRIGVVVPVAPFGRPVAQEPWRTFRRLTNIPVVIDGAASFDTAPRAPDVNMGEIPIALSFHATKSFGTGEGGAMATSDIELATRATRALNFGFHGTRDSRSASTNGKMSEYNAAVGLAELDGWEDKQLASSRVMEIYRRSMEEVQLSNFLCIAPDISTSYVLFVCRTSDEAKSVQVSLDRHEIDSRLWYGSGVQHHTYFSALARDSLDTTEAVSPRLIGLPVAPDLTESDIRRIVTAVREGLRG
jgi:dTDP-4-amino-4,6-dideoxygalactose transaminase